jgi:2,3-bisphosphoglycerate-dependent phosphoglycerate mutase
MNEPDDAVPASPSLMRRRRPFLAPLWLLGLGGVIMLFGAILYWNSATTTTIVVIRHGEKQLNTISDAPLSPPGETRAARLAQMFGDAQAFGGVRKIYVTNTRRTQQTAAALAQRLGLTPVVVEAKTDSAALAHQALSENRGGVALIVGHSNTVPDIVKTLTKADNVPEMGDEEFDTLYVVSVPTIGKASVVRLKY